MLHKQLLFTNIYSRRKGICVFKKTPKNIITVGKKIFLCLDTLVK
jgi:hypothetical protein